MDGHAEVIRLTLRYDTVRVSQGKDLVAVRGFGPGQHIVTAMVR